MRNSGLFREKLVFKPNLFQIVEYDHRFDFYCQHGSKECRANMIQCCALDTLVANQDYDRVLPFFKCMLEQFEYRSPNIDNISYKVS